MSRRSAHLDFSIRGDELEQQRVQLEHNLQHTDLSLHLSSTPDEHSDVEYPRHASVPSPPFSAFASFDHHSGEDYDPHEQSRFHAWSYHTDDGVQPYAAESLSTAAHHASALTISAGLGGGRGARRDLSLSGAEYDPERPLQGIMAGIAGRVKGFDANSTKSRQITASVVDFDPLVVDNTAELDRVLQSGHASPRAIPSTHSTSSSSSSDVTEPISPQPQQDSRPRLADALSHLTFSPKRPRSAQGFASPRVANVTILNSTPDRSVVARHPPLSTPRPQRRMNQSLSYAQHSVSALYGHTEPEVQITPATPSLHQSRRERQQADDSSKFTTMARGLAREIEAEADAAMKRSVRQAAAEATPRAAYHHSTIPARKHQHQRSPLKQMVVGEKSDRMSFAATPFRKSVQLPDVTGLTSAVASPAKVDVEFYGYDPRNTTEAEARLVATLAIVQNQLSHLEAENSVSRRRVLELELELEACKKEVARERTRILEQEQSISRDGEPSKKRVVSQRERMQQQQQQQSRQQKKAEDDQVELAAAEARYKAAVEEKKALEALITTLRSHLTRLTAELSEHKQLLLELRSLRDSDAHALAEKSKEVDKLKQEVERLAGEVEVLRGVVEEGLKERRGFREQPVSHSTPVSAEQSSEDGSEDEESQVQTQQPQQQQPTVESDESEDEVTEEESMSRRSPTPSPRRRLGAGPADRTMRTDRATLASSQCPSLAASANANASEPFLDEEEVSRISQEVEERRYERSIQSHSQDSSQSASEPQERSRSWSHQPVPGQSRKVSRASSPSMVLEPDASGSTAPPNLVRQLEHSVRFAAESSHPPNGRPPSPHADISHQQTQPQLRPTAPTPAAAQRSASTSQKRRAYSVTQVDGEPAFPQIRGARLEQLFFSVPEHNAETCTICHRRRRRRAAEVEQATSWLREHQQHRTKDEGFVEGAEDAQDRRAYAGRAARGQESDRVPPQTVLARVLRELEDDFTHYKSIYVELADQYKDMDPVSNVIKRNVLADHLREVIDILEQKGNQIASLYDLLTFKDKPLGESVAPDEAASSMNRGAQIFSPLAARRAPESLGGW